MLSQDAAEQILNQWKIDRSPEGPLNGISSTRFLPLYLKLPKKLRKIACSLYQLDEQGQKLQEDAQDKQDEGFNDLLALSPKDRSRILSIALPQLASPIEQTLVWLKSTPYQRGYERKGFRTQQDSQGKTSQQAELIEGFLHLAEHFQEDIITPAWCVVWAPYIRVNWVLLEGLATPLLAAVIQSRGKTGDEVFEILLQCGRNEHEHGGLGRHVISGLLAADRAEGWEFVEKLLLAAQRQEGLRQVILESVDLAHPDAFQQMLRVIIDNDLARFSAVTRALNTWLGYAWDSASTKVVNQTLRQASDFLSDASARKKAAAGSDPEAAYLALWAMSIFEAMDSIEPAKKLLKSKQVELRYVAVVHLRHLHLPDATTPVLQQVMGKDEDLRVAYLAATAVSEAERVSDEQFELIESLVSRLPAKPEVLPALVWPWSQMRVDRSSIASMLPGSLQNRPLTRFLPYLPMMTPWSRVRILSEFSKGQNWLPEVREVIVGLTGDSSADVRKMAFYTLDKATLTTEESEHLEKLLTRKSADVRTGVIHLLTKQADDSALESADRLLNSKTVPQRLAGLEIVRNLKEQERSVKECQSRAESYQQNRKQISKEEETHLDAIQGKISSTAELSLENGLGLFDPSRLSPGQPPQEKKVALWTAAAEKSLLALDELIHSHRETPFTTNKKTVLLGTADWDFPSLYWVKRGLDELPLREIWEDWVKNRPKQLRDKDGLELLRACIAFDFFDSYRYTSTKEWLEGSPDRKPIFNLVNFKLPKLRYPRLIERLLRWLLIIEPPHAVIDYLADCVETLCSKISPQDIQSLHPDHAKPIVWEYYHSNVDDNPIYEDWRKESPVSHWWDLLSSECSSQKLTPEQLKRVWKFACWLDRPIPGAIRYRCQNSILFQAYKASSANLNDVADALLGPREQGKSMPLFPLLKSFTSRRPEKIDSEFLEQAPEVKELVKQAVETILEIELSRGDTPTIATQPAIDLASVTGITRLRRLLAKLGKTGFKASNIYYRHEHLAEVLTHLATVTYPAAEETPEQFRQAMKSAVKAKEFPEERLIQLAFLAPQWVKHIEEYFRWPGFAEGIYWFMAHMSFLWGSNVGERAAEGAGIVDQPQETEGLASDDESGSSDTETSEDTQHDNSSAPSPAPRLTPWQRLIVERTPLSLADREIGAVDVAWFLRVYEVLGAKHWQGLAQAARFASTPAQAKKAKAIADVLLGKADLKVLIAGIEQRQLKDNVRLLGLYPLPNGAKRDTELKRRFHILQAYRQYARGLSGLTKPQAMQALETGLKNLAATAGYADPIRLEWALGAEEQKDLAKGPLTATKEGVSVTLQLNEDSQPVLSFARGEKPLKSVPAATKKDPKIAELFERSKEIKRKASRLREALEQCMCRGDTFNSQELVSLMSHPLVAPLLQRLVMVGEGIMGYPTHHGKALRDFSGKVEPINKNELLRIAHADDLFHAKNWSDWQRDCFEAERIQPFKQIFRELYVLTKQEKADRDASHRYAGQQVNPQQAYALWGNRGWNSGDEVFKTFHELGLTVTVDFNYGITTPLEVEGLTLDSIRFFQRENERFTALQLKDVPRRVFSEVMRDCDLVVSVAHRGGVDPEASAGTVEMRASLVKETCQLMGLKNVRIKANQVVIDGSLSQYSVHLGSGTVHRLPGGSLCIVPVHAQHRGRLFLPFADDDPRSAEVLSKVLLLARDQEIQDPSILEQLRA